ncbi:MAG TPA: glutathione S-transferase [Candidatus Binatia bacterium]|nr:glutathione S-transferase [Candidatus Binatia bacterium]
MAGADTVPVLWQFRASHFNEKARWALDWKRIPHVRRSLLPGFHVPRVMWMTGQKSVPVLVLDGKAVADSTRIIETLEQRWPDRPLYPADPAARRRALELEEFFDEELGPHVRRAAFHDVLPNTDYAVAFFTTGAGPVARAAYRAIFPVLRPVMRADMAIDPGRAARSWEKTVAALDRVERELQPSGYLVGDAFSVADLTAAALFAPLVGPPEFPYPLPAPVPEPMASKRASLVARPGFRWVEQMYHRHRGRSAEVDR